MPRKRSIKLSYTHGLTIMPGLSMNCLLTSVTTSCAVRPTAEHAHALNKKMSIEPNNPPINTSGIAISTWIEI